MTAIWSIAAIDGRHIALRPRQRVFYREDQQLLLKKLMEEFSVKVKRAGIVFKATDFEDI